MKMKNIIITILTFAIGFVEAWGQTQTLEAGRYHSVESGSTNSIPIAIQENAVVIYRVNPNVTVNISASSGGDNINASGRTGARPAIILPASSTLVITGDGTINLTGGNAANGISGGISSTGGDGGGGAAPGIGGMGGTGGKGAWTSSEAKYGTLGTDMGKLYILGNVTVNAKKGKEGESKVGTWGVGGGDGGHVPDYAIGAGGRGGNSKDGESSASSSPYYNQTSDNGFIFQQSTATITYKNSQGGTDTSRPDVQTILTLNHLSDVGYTFTGYRVGETWVVDEYGVFVDGGNLFDKTITVLDERWTKTITLDQQGGTGGSEEIEVVYGCSMKAATAPSKSGYTFMGYFTEPNGEGTKYYNADMSSAHIWDKANNTTTLYAHWTANSYTVTLDANGGTGGTTSVSATYDSAMPSATAPTKTGYNFLGYYYNYTQYYDESMNSIQTWDRTSATTLQAHWAVKQCTVILDADAVVTTPGTASVNNVTYDQPMPTPEGLTAPTRTGYTFGGYYIGHNGSGTQYYTASMTSATNWLEDTESETTLYAKWTANQYTVSFNARGGSPTPGDITVTYDAEYGTLPTPTRYGFTFDGWYTGETSGTQVTSSTTVHITDDQTLYAHWNPITTDYDSYSVIGDPRLRGNYFRSFYDSHVAYELPDGVTAYKGQADGQYLVLTKIEVTDNNKNILPKDVPVILVAEPSYIDAKTEKGPEPTTGVSIKEISLTTSEYDVAYDGITGNMLIGTDVDIPVPNDSYLYYILSYGTVTKRLGFYKWPEGNTLSAHKAYVQQSPSSPAKALIFRFENEATGINDDAILDFADDASEPVIYNLNGIRFSKPQKGVNIINGKKVWVK